VGSSVAYLGREVVFARALPLLVVESLGGVKLLETLLKVPQVFCDEVVDIALSRGLGRIHHARDSAHRQVVLRGRNFSHSCDTDFVDFGYRCAFLLNRRFKLLQTSGILRYTCIRGVRSRSKLKEQFLIEIDS
jgi:hypothetical protein